MQKAEIIFANGDTLLIEENDFYIPIILTEHNGSSFTSMSEPFEITGHNHDGLIPSITELCLKASFFCHVDKRDKAYKSSAIVSIENI